MKGKEAKAQSASIWEPRLRIVFPEETPRRLAWDAKVKSNKQKTGLSFGTVFGFETVNTS